MPIRIGEFTTVSTSNFYFYPPLGSSSTPQGYLLATGPTGFMVPQNPNTLASTIVGGGYLDSSISTTISSTNACLSQTSTLTTYVSINTASISSLGDQVSTISTNLQNLSNYVVANIGSAPYLSTQVSSLTAGYSTLVADFSSLSTYVDNQATKLQSVSDSLSSTIYNVSSLSTTISSLVTNVSSLSLTVSSLSSFVTGQAAFTCTISDSLSANIINVSTLSSFVRSQSTLVGQTAISLCTTVSTLSNVSTVVAGLAAGTVTVGDFTALSTYTSSLGASVGFLTLDLSTLNLRVSTLSTNVSSLQSTTNYLLANSLTSTGVLGLLSSQTNLWLGSNIQVSSVASNLYFNSGRVGIGCNAPTSNFVVVGTSLFTGASLISSSLTTSSNFRVNRNTSTLLNADASIFTVLVGNVPTKNNILNVQGGGYFIGGLDVNMNSYFRSTVDVTSGNFTVNTNTLYVNTATGRVGIGCNAPAATLDVNGDLHAASTVNFDQTLRVSSLLYVNSNVGIGCNAPAYTLDVRGTTHTSTLIVDSVISTNYVVQRTPLIWSYGLFGNSLASAVVPYNTIFNEAISGYYSGGYFFIPFTGLYRIDISAVVTTAGVSRGDVILNLSNTTQSNYLWSGWGATATTGADPADAQSSQVSFSFTSTFTSANSTRIFTTYLNSVNVNVFANGIMTIQYLG